MQGSEGGATLLTSIVSLDPIYIYFDMDEATYLRNSRLWFEGKRPSSRDTPNPVQVTLTGETKPSHEGKMDFLDNRLDVSTGTLRSRAVVPNKDLSILPGQFGRVRLIGSAPYEALLLPDTAIATDQSRKIVFVVKDDDTVEAKAGRARAARRRPARGPRGPQGGRPRDRRRPAARPRRRQGDTETRRCRATSASRCQAMNLGRLSINQPILAMVLSIVLLIVGAIAYTTLPVSEYPQVAPPTVVVTTQYPGASAQTVSDTVAAPIEQEINGVEDMLYLYSQATSNGQLTITVTFKLGTDLDKAQVLVQNRVAIAQPRLPEEVQRNGVVTRKNSPDILMVVFMLSPDDTLRPALHLQLRAAAGPRPAAAARRRRRHPDVRRARLLDAAVARSRPDRQSRPDLGRRAGRDPRRRTCRSPAARSPSRRSPIAPSSPTSSSPAGSRIRRQFEDILVKAGADGRIVRLRDVARIELGALSYSTNSFLLRKSAVALAGDAAAGIERAGDREAASPTRWRS